MTLTHPDRLFPIDSSTRAIARALYQTVAELPIISPHGHCDPRWFAENKRFPNPAELFIIPDHYVFRMLSSQGIPLSDLGVPRIDGGETESDPHKIWRLFADHYYLFRGTPSAGWLDHAFEHVFGLDEPLTPDNADAYDAVVDPEFEGFIENVVQLGALTNEDTLSWSGYLQAHRIRRAYFKSLGATASDHGHLTARTENMPAVEAEKLFQKALKGECSADESDAFRGQMLTEMARMSLDDGLVLQIHPGSYRNHSAGVFAGYGRDKGFDIPKADAIEVAHGLAYGLAKKAYRL